MADFVTLSCPTCGGKLQVTPDLDRFACAHCGNEHVVRRGGGIVSLAPVVEGIDKVRVGVDKTASELAIRRLKEEIADLRRRREEGLARLQRLRKEATSALQRQPPAPLRMSERPVASDRLGIILSVVGFLLMFLAQTPAFAAALAPGLGFLAAGLSLFFYGDKEMRRRNAEHAFNLEASQKQRSERDSQITARIAQLDVEIATKIAELDAPIAARTAELEEHSRTVRIR
jgi:hypothetical protein